MNKILDYKNGMFISLRWVLLLSVAGVLTVVLAAVFFWFYQFVTDQTIGQTKKSLTQAAEVVALRVKPEMMVALMKDGKPNANGSSDDPRYTQLMDELEAVHKIEPRAWPYLWVYDYDTHEDVYVADLFARYNTKKSFGFLERYKDTLPSDVLSYHTDDNGNFIPIQDELGEWYSAYLPLRDSTGLVIGGVGADFEAADVHEVQAKLRNIILIAFAATYLFVLLAIFWLSGKISDPIARLTRAAEAVGEGNYDQDFSVLLKSRPFKDEVAVLAVVFDRMVDKVQHRVETLQQELVELKIEIDHTKRQNQVDEIVGTDFFRDLQIKAETLRRRREDLNSN